MHLPMLDDQPDILAPRAALLRRRAVARPGSGLLVVSRGVSLISTADGWVVRVIDAEQITVREFGLSANSFGVLKRLVPGASAPPLDVFVQTVLVDAGVLVAAESDVDHGLDQSLLEDRASFAAKGYAVVNDALHPYDVAAIRRYLRNGIRTGSITFGDRQVPSRYHAHNDPLLRVHQKRLIPLVASIVGVPVKPSYVYLSAYTEGSMLHRHLDRPQCEYSLTISVDYTPEPTLEAAWPIRLALQDAELIVYQSLGDALLFTGRRLTHFREPLPPGHISTSLLLHYVDSNFKGSLN